MTTQLDVALSYIGSGIPVFPCRPAEEMDSNTGEFLKAKTPYPSNGLKSATLNERIVREWWKRTPAAMIGVPTGARSRFFVLDLDVKPGVGDGHEWLDQMEAEHGALPETAKSKTMNGGTHIFFTFVEGIRNRGNLGIAVDIRGDGGYIIAPGSIASDGRSYTWIDAEALPPIADAPQWLLDLVTPPARPAHQAGEFTYTPTDHAPYVNAAVEAEMTKLANTGPGGRGYQLNASAFSLGQLVGAGVLSRSAAEEELYRAAQHNGGLSQDGEPETLRKIKRGLDTGEREPRHIPERETDNTRLVDVSRMIANGLAKAERVKEQPAEQTPDEISEPANDNGPIHATPFEFLDRTKIPRRSFAFGTHYIRKYVSVTVAPGGLGKTANSIVDALAMASGRNLAGTKPGDRLRVWMFNSEDPRDELERRIMAACVHYGLGAADINGHLFLDTGREQELVVAHEDKRTGVRINEPVVEAVVEQIQRLGIDVMIVDPFVSTHGVNENDNGAIDKVAKLWSQIADVTNCAIDIVHHLRKVADREATVEDARGAVSLIGAARSVRVLNRMSEEQAQQAGMDPKERLSIFSVVYGKSNLTPLSGSADWRKLVSVGLGNGGKGNLASVRQDMVPVVTEWKWPDKSELTDDVTEDQKAQIAVRVENADFRFNAQAKDWIGHEVAFVLGLDTGDHAVKQRVKRMIDAWLESGFLIKDRRRDSVKREMKEFVAMGGA